MKEKSWELMVLDGRSSRTLVGDVDGDGHKEIVSNHYWYRPATGERGAIRGGIDAGGVGATTGDVDGDGRMEVVGGVENDQTDAEGWTMCWYKPGEDLSQPGARHVIHRKLIGHPHDQLVVDPLGSSGGALDESPHLFDLRRLRVEEDVVMDRDDVVLTPQVRPHTDLGVPERDLQLVEFVQSLIILQRKMAGDALTAQQRRVARGLRAKS